MKKILCYALAATTLALTSCKKMYWKPRQQQTMQFIS